MFNEIEVAKAEYQLQNAKYNNAQEVEGATVQVPNILDHVVLGLRAIVSRRAPKVQQTRATFRHGGAVAK